MQWRCFRSERAAEYGLGSSTTNFGCLSRDLCQPLRFLSTNCSVPVWSMTNHPGLVSIPGSSVRLPACLSSSPLPAAGGMVMDDAQNSEPNLGGSAMAGPIFAEQDQAQ